MSQIMPNWKHFEHKADIGIRGYGNNLLEAFEQTALAMTAVVADIKKIRQENSLSIVCKETDIELLLVDWLNALIYEMTTRKMLFSKYDIEIQGSGILTATVSGETVDVARHEPAVEIKGATYTELEVRELKNGTWRAQCVVDV